MDDGDDNDGNRSKLQHSQARSKASCSTVATHLQQTRPLEGRRPPPAASQQQERQPSRSSTV